MCTAPREGTDDHAVQDLRPAAEMTGEQPRAMMISELCQWLRSRTNKEKRPFQEETITAYKVAARALDAWMTSCGLDGDFTACDTEVLNRYAPVKTRPSTLSTDFIKDLLEVTGSRSSGSFRSRVPARSTRGGWCRCPRPPPGPYRRTCGCGATTGTRPLRSCG